MGDMAIESYGELIPVYNAEAGDPNAFTVSVPVYGPLVAPAQGVAPRTPFHWPRTGEFLYGDKLFIAPWIPDSEFDTKPHEIRYSTVAGNAGIPSFAYPAGQIGSDVGIDYTGPIELAPNLRYVARKYGFVRSSALSTGSGISIKVKTILVKYTGLTID